MDIPPYITEQIAQRMGGRFRLRWSEPEKMFLYEQRVRRGMAEGFVSRARHAQETPEQYEARVRAADGYVLALKISPGTTTHCSTCHTPIAVPAFKTAQIACPYCEMKGRKRFVMGGYWPLSDSLLDELERRDPDRGGSERLAADVTRANALAEREREWQLTAPAEAAFHERFRRIIGIPQVGVSHTAWMPGTSLTP